MVVCETCGKNTFEFTAAKIHDGYLCSECNVRFQKMVGPHDERMQYGKTYRHLLEHPADAERITRKPSSLLSSCLLCGKQFSSMPKKDSNKPPFYTSDGRFLCKSCVEDCVTISEEFAYSPKEMIKAHDSEYFRKNMSDCLHPDPLITFNYNTKKIHVKVAFQKKNYHVISFSDITSFRLTAPPDSWMNVNYRHGGATKLFRAHAPGDESDLIYWSTRKTLDCFYRVPEVQALLSGTPNIGGFNGTASADAAPRTVGLACPRCGGTNCTPIVETSTSGKDFSAGKGCCGYVLLGPIGILCGACGKGKQTTSTTYWMCSNCGNKFRQ